MWYSSAINQHKSWIQFLQVGDKVCDCRLKHIKIIKITDDTDAIRPWIYRQVIFSDWFPFVLGNWIDDVWDRFCFWTGLVVIFDRDLILEDGANCSAMSCCHPDNHQDFYDDKNVLIKCER